MSLKTEETSVANRIRKLRLLEAYVADHQKKAKAVVKQPGVFFTYMYRHTETGGKTNERIGCVLSRLQGSDINIGWSICSHSDDFYACVAISKAFARTAAAAPVPSQFTKELIEEVDRSAWRAWCKTQGIPKKARFRLLRMVIRASRYHAKNQREPRTEPKTMMPKPSTAQQPQETTKVS